MYELARLTTSQLGPHWLHLLFWIRCLQTYTGGILIAVNPFEWLPNLYHPLKKLQYQGAPLGELAPHVFAVADEAYRYEALCCGQPILSIASGTRPSLSL